MTAPSAPPRTHMPGRWRAHYELATQQDLDAASGIVAGRDPRAGAW